MPIENPDRIASLLTLVEKITTVAPNATHLLSEAMSEIHKLNETIRREKLAEQGHPVTPDPVTEATGGEPSTPVDESITTDTPMPEVDPDTTIRRL